MFLLSAIEVVVHYFVSSQCSVFCDFFPHVFRRILALSFFDIPIILTSFYSTRRLCLFYILYFLHLRAKYFTNLKFFTWDECSMFSFRFTEFLCLLASAFFIFFSAFFGWNIFLKWPVIAKKMTRKIDATEKCSCRDNFLFARHLLCCSTNIFSSSFSSAGNWNIKRFAKKEIQSTVVKCIIFVPIFLSALSQVPLLYYFLVM